jgi:dolichyl-phosphate-mannose-protein mannosyltransferase
LIRSSILAHLLSLEPSVNLDTATNQKLAMRGLILVCIVGFGLRFWGLERFNLLVFDEVYYAVFGNNYLTHTPFFNSHPPLSQYLIAIGIWIGDRLPFGQEVSNTFTGSLHSTISYRWINALFGSLIPPIVAALFYQLSQRKSYAFLAALFVSLDGLFLVESRYALNSIFLVFFGLLGQLLVLIAIKRDRNHDRLILALAGISLGASIACKWNGLAFLIAIYILIAIAKLWTSIRSDESSEIIDDSLFDRLARIQPIEIIISLTIVPIITYSLLWIPHLIQNPNPNFIGVHVAMIDYHKHIGDNTGVHPYCSKWYTWPLMLRPLAYQFTEYKPNYYYDVHAMGNPLLWWLGIAAIFGAIWSIGYQVWLNSKRLTIEKNILAPIRNLDPNNLSVPLFIVINYAVNLLPWIPITRCLFIYHYLGGVLFAIVGLAWFVDNWLRSHSKFWQAVGLTTIFSVAATFVFWLPVYLGLSIEKTDLSLRLWDFWIFHWI